MFDFFLQSINFVKLYVIFTLVFALTLGIRKKNHRLLLGILFVSFFAELIDSVLLYHKQSIGFSATLNVILHHSLWLLILYNNCLLKKTIGMFCIAFWSFSVFNLFLGEGLTAFNFSTFIVGAFLYIVAFILESFNHLKQENFDFFTSNDYLLLLAPVFFFFGLTFIFGFKSKELATTVIFENIKLYSFIMSVVNIIYYSLLTIYIYKEKKQSHV
ncbi:MAG: hypothetical protein ABI426_12295 [Flavobacterium sp.]